MNRYTRFALLTALLVRLPGLFAPLWFDEMFTGLIMRLPLAEALAAVRGDVHPPLFFMLAWALGNVLLVRVVLFGVSLLTLLVAQRLAAALHLSPTVQAVALFALALSPMQIFYAADLRPYAMLQLLALLVAVAAVERRPVLFAAAAAPMLWAHHYGWIYAAVAGLYLAAQLLPVRNWRGVLTAALPPLGLYVPLAASTAGQVGAVTAHYWIPPVSPADFILTLTQLLTSESWVTPVIVPTVVAIFAVVVFAIGRAIVERRFDLLVFAIGPMYVAALLSLHTPIYLTRYLLAQSAPLFFLVVWALVDGVPLAGRVWLACALVPMLAITYASDRTRANLANRENAAEMAAIIRAEPAPVWHDSLGTMVALSYTAPDLTNVIAPQPPTLGGLYSPATRRALGFVEAAYTDTPATFWAVFTNSEQPTTTDCITWPATGTQTKISLCKITR